MMMTMPPSIRVRVGSKAEIMSSLRRRSRNKPKKQVSFDSKDYIAETIGKHQYSRREFERTWYTKEEMRDITDECLLLVDIMGGGVVLDDDENYCTRGLEPHATFGSIIKRKARRGSIKAVLSEQKRQKKHKNKKDIYSIARSYSKNTSSSEMWAQVVAIHDQREAELYLFDSQDEEEMYAMEQQMMMNIEQNAALQEFVPEEKRNQKRNQMSARAA